MTTDEPAVANTAAISSNEVESKDIAVTESSSMSGLGFNLDEVDVQEIDDFINTDVHSSGLGDIPDAIFELDNSQKSNDETQVLSVSVSEASQDLVSTQQTIEKSETSQEKATAEEKNIEQSTPVNLSQQNLEAESEITAEAIAAAHERQYQAQLKATGIAPTRQAVNTVQQVEVSNTVDEDKVAQQPSTQALKSTPVTGTLSQNNKPVDLQEPSLSEVQVKSTQNLEDNSATVVEKTEKTEKAEPAEMDEVESL